MIESQRTSKSVRPTLWSRLPGLAGTLAVVGAIIINGSMARAAAAQVWSPFVLVTGLLLVGLVADHDGLFLAAGRWLACTTSNPITLFVAATVLITLVTAVLNLDTSVAFLTPVLIYTARSRGDIEAPFLYGALLLSNAASLYLPGSNLTNLIVLHHQHLSGVAFLSDIWVPTTSAVVITALVVMAFHFRNLRVPAHRPVSTPPARLTLGIGLGAVILTTVLVVTLRTPALPVLVVGLVAVGIEMAGRQAQLRQVTETLGVSVLIGLFGAAVALGTIGRVWSGPAALLSHLDVWGTAGLAAACSVFFNNLPSASLLAAHPPAHPFALLIGLNLGPNLCVTGSLAWILWLRTARSASAQPDIWRASRIGLVAVPLSMAAALGLLVAQGSSVAAGHF